MFLQFSFLSRVTWQVFSAILQSARKYLSDVSRRRQERRRQICQTSSKQTRVLELFPASIQAAKRPLFFEFFQKCYLLFVIIIISSSFLKFFSQAVNLYHAQHSLYSFYIFQSSLLCVWDFKIKFWRSFVKRTEDEKGSICIYFSFFLGVRSE